jgi:hypothetical protein
MWPNPDKVATEPRKDYDMTDMLSKARLGRLVALEGRGKTEFIRAAVEHRMVRDTVVSFQSRRALVA